MQSIVFVNHLPRLDAQRQYMVIGTLALHLIFCMCDLLCEQGSGPGGDRRGKCSVW